MVYKDFKGLALSALGFGAMRLPVLDGNDAAIDEAAAEEMVDYAMRHGINYYDTAWGYHEGNSELVMGKILSKYPRESFYLATKFPGYDLANMPKVEEIFERQIEKCRVEYFDFYLIHNVCEMNIDAYLDEKYGILPYLLKQKEKGRIRHLGFSAHGTCGVMERFLEKYGAHMEFCQLQINYIDWSFQSAEDKVKLLDRHGIPVWVMEPLRGGRLARLSAAEGEALRAIRPDEKIPAWAFRFAQSIPQVKVTLSGMSNMEQLKDNIGTFAEDKPLTEAEMRGLFAVVKGMLDGVLPCTACRYCTSHCPKGLDIPTLLGLYNEHRFSEGGFIAPMVVSTLPDDKKPAACVGCRSCEKVCPQQIKISEAMADFGRRLGDK